MPQKGQPWSPEAKAKMLESRRAFFSARETKFCPKCAQDVPVDGFKLRSSGALQSYCTPCQQAAGARKTERYRGKRGEEQLERDRRANRRIQYRRKYGITVEQYDELFLAQGNCCAICHSTDPGRGFINLHVDHDHTSGAIRGLLCNVCNNGLGYFKDNPALLARAIDYLQADPPIPGGAPAELEPDEEEWK